MGYVHVYTGEGKGKTTAALGLTLRALGAGLRVCIIQFAKHGTYSEMQALERFGDQVAVHQFGTGEWIQGAPSEAETACAREGLAFAREQMVSGEWDVVVLDEANCATYFGMFGAADLLEVVEARAERTEVVITGRRADALIMEKADLVTEMTEVRHYYAAGVKSRKGIEE